MVRRAIPMIAFPRVRTICVCIVYVVKEVWGLSQLMGVVRNRTHAQALQKKSACSLHRNWTFYLKYIPKVLQDPLKDKKSR